VDGTDNKKRRLPRHVDGRIMIGLMPIKNFFLMAPIAAAIILAVIKYFSPAIFFAGVLLLGIVIGLFSEFHQRETGFLILKDIIKYAVLKDIYFERDTKSVSSNKRLIRFKDKKS
jgi:hypothetical protein